MSISPAPSVVSEAPEVLEPGHADLTLTTSASIEPLRIDPDTRIPVKGVQMVYRDIEAAVAQDKVEIVRRYLSLGDFAQAMKDYLPHGEFVQWVQGNMGFSPRTAQVCMRLANRYNSDAQFRQLVKRAGPIQITKLREIVRLSTDEVDQIVEQGGVGDIPVDELHTRSRDQLVDELKKLRREKEDAESELATTKAETDGLKNKVRELAGERALDDRSEHARKTAKALETEFRAVFEKLANFHAEYLEEDRTNFRKLDAMAQADVERLFTGLHIHTQVLAMSFEFAVMEPFGRPSVADDIADRQALARDEHDWAIPDSHTGTRVFRVVQSGAVDQGGLDD